VFVFADNNEQTAKI